jgi:cleavage and polyadenylation specificity factor subunit 4
MMISFSLLDCPWYDRGFCRHGPNCKNRHTRKVLCQNYLCGFCPEGPRCTLSHPTFELPNSNEYTPAQRKIVFVCDFCHETGHKASSCFKLPYEERQKYLNMPANNFQSQPYNNHRPPFNQNHNHDGGSSQQSGNSHSTDEQHPPGPGLSQPFQHDVTCFKCGERGYDKSNQFLFFLYLISLF